MFYKEKIDKAVEQTLNYVDNFLNVFTLDGNTLIKLETTCDVMESLFSISIMTSNYFFSSNLGISGAAKRIVYDKVFWSLFHKYIADDDIQVKKEIDENSEKGNSWQIRLHNFRTNSNVILEFAIENEKDFHWISTSFDKWDYLIDSEKQKVKKLENG